MMTRTLLDRRKFLRDAEKGREVVICAPSLVVWSKNFIGCLFSCRRVRSESKTSFTLALSE